MMYNYIVNPKTNRKVRVDTPLGKDIIKNYVMDGGEPLLNFFKGLVKKPSRPTTEIHFLSTPKGQALVKDLTAVGIKINRTMISNAKFEELVQLLAKAGVKDKSGKIVTPATWEADWIAKNKKYESRISPVMTAKNELERLYRTAFKDNLLTMEESRRKSEADKTVKGLKNALETYKKSIDKFSRHYPTTNIKNTTLIEKVTKAMKQLEELVNPQDKSSAPKKRSSSRKRSLSRKKSSSRKSEERKPPPMKKGEPVSVAGIRNQNRKRRPNKGREKMLKSMGFTKS